MDILVNELNELYRKWVELALARPARVLLVGLTQWALSVAFYHAKVRGVNPH